MPGRDFTTVQRNSNQSVNNLIRTNFIQHSIIQEVTFYSVHIISKTPVSLCFRSQHD